jgi:hypothetical protein
MKTAVDWIGISSNESTSWPPVCGEVMKQTGAFVYVIFMRAAHRWGLRQWINEKAVASLAAQGQATLCLMKISSDGAFSIHTGLTGKGFYTQDNDGLVHGLVMGLTESFWCTACRQQRLREILHLAMLNLPRVRWPCHAVSGCSLAIRGYPYARMGWNWLLPRATRCMCKI